MWNIRAKYPRHETSALGEARRVGIGANSFGTNLLDAVAVNFVGDAVAVAITIEV